MKEASRAIICDSASRVLLGKRPHHMKAEPGKYILIGGKVDDGESPEAAVIREVKEEIGLDFQPVLYGSHVNNDPALGPWLMHYFTGEASGTLTLDPSEVDSIVYASARDLETLDIAFDQRERLREYFRSL